MPVRSGDASSDRRYARSVGVAGRSCSRLSRRLGRGAVGVAAVAALWWLVAWVFSSDRGIGFRDEGLFLLAADPPSPTARWVTPFGWHIAPFFQLVGYDVARLRTFAVTALVLAGALCGWVIGRRVTDDEPGVNERFTRWCLAAVGAFGAPLLTSGLLRTPGYNWVNLVGLLVAVTGAVLALLLPLDGPPLWSSRRAHTAAAVLAAGVWFTVPAKPSSAPLFLATAAVFVAPRLRSRTWSFAVLTALWGLGWTAFGVVARWWPTTFLVVLRRSAQFPPLDRNQTIRGAFRDVLRTPKVAAHDLALLRPAALVVIAVATALAVVACKRRRTGPVLRSAPFVLSTIAAVGTAVPWPVLGEPNPPVRLAWYGTTNAGVLLFTGALLHLGAHWPRTEPAARRRGLAVAGLCIATIFIFGFGSALSIYHQAALAAALMWCAAAAVVATAGEQRLRSATVGVIAVAAFAMLVSNVVDSRHHPFDVTDVAKEHSPTRFGVHGDELLVDEATASFLDRLQATARNAGFCAGTPLIGMVWDWTSTTAFALGARVPEHLIVTIFGYPDAASVLDVTMRDFSGPRWHDAWVLTTNPDTVDATKAAEVRAALDRLPDAVARTFPDDYTIESDVDGTQLWRPTDLTAEKCR